MTAPYKKRAKAGWNSDKEQSNKDERSFNKTEIVKESLVSSEVETFLIREEIIEDEYIKANYETKEHKAFKKRKKKTPKAKDIRNKIVTVERHIRFWTDRLSNSKYTHGIVQRYVKELKNLNQELLELEKK